MSDQTSGKAFAIDVVRRLQQADFETYWAGGCVRDLLRGVAPKDYDVATAATPEQVREIFGTKRTRGVGVAFGVMLVHGPRELEPVEVATFRTDGQYSDGRRPDSVEFTSAENDAKRRDFTVNGMFYDPVAEKVIDFVNGRLDLENRVLRAIGEPADRFREDKLRLLRAIRFAANLDFQLEPHTRQVISELAGDITAVSGERIGNELRRMLVHPSRVHAVTMLYELGLWSTASPSANERWNIGSRYEEVTGCLKRLDVSDLEPDDQFAATMALLLGCDWRERKPYDDAAGAILMDITSRWKLSNDERDRIAWIAEQVTILFAANDLKWHQLQPVVAHDWFPAARCVAAAIAGHFQMDQRGIQHAQRKSQLPDSQLCPIRWVTGDMLIKEGHHPGPSFRLALERAWQAQLDGDATTEAEAMEIAKQVMSGQ